MRPAAPPATGLLVWDEHGRISDNVDRLLEHTQTLMGPVSSTTMRRHIVAFSGGVDSSLVAALLYQCRTSANPLIQQEPQPQPQKEHVVHAMLGLSPAVPQEQVDLAQRVADHIGIPLTMIQTQEGQDETYLANQGQACLACKTHLYSAMRAVVDHVRNEEPSNENRRSDLIQLYNGTNADDVQDPTRLGLIAAHQFQVLSPLQYITKDQVRQASKHLGLPIWNYAASPCLRSRLALGVRATMDHLERIDQAERMVRQQFLHAVLDETSNLRVRLLAGNRARIELDAVHVPHAQQVWEANGWDQRFCHELGFASVSIQSFRSGSVSTKTEEAEESTTRTTTDQQQQQHQEEEEDVVVTMHAGAG